MADLKSSSDIKAQAISNLDPNINKLAEQSKVMAATLSQQSASISALKDSLSNKEQNDSNANRNIVSSIQKATKSITSINDTLNRVKQYLTNITSTITSSTSTDSIKLLSSVNISLIQIASVISAFRADFLMASNGKDINGEGYYDVNLLRSFINNIGAGDQNEMNKAANYANRASNAVRSQIGNNNLDEDENPILGSILGIANTIKGLAGYTQLINDDTENKTLSSIKNIGGKILNADTESVSGLIGSFMTDQQKAEILSPLAQTARDYQNSEDPLLQKIGGLLGQAGFKEETKEREKSPTLVFSALAPFADDIKDMVETQYEAFKERPKIIPLYATPVWVVNSKYQTDFVDKSNGTFEEDLLNKRANEILEGINTNNKDKYGNSLFEIEDRETTDEEGNVKNHIIVKGKIGEKIKENELKKGNANYKETIQKMREDADKRVYDRNHEDAIWIDEKGEEHKANSVIKNDIRELGKIENTGYFANLANLDFSEGTANLLNQNNINAIVGMIMGFFDAEQQANSKDAIDKIKTTSTHVYENIKKNNEEKNKENKPEENKELSKEIKNSVKKDLTEKDKSENFSLSLSWNHKVSTNNIQSPIKNNDEKTSYSDDINSTLLIGAGLTGLVSITSQENILLSQIINTGTIDLKNISKPDIFNRYNQLLIEYNATNDIISASNEYENLSDITKIITPPKKKTLTTNEYITGEKKKFSNKESNNNENTDVENNKTDSKEKNTKNKFSMKSLAIGAITTIAVSLLTKAIMTKLKNYVKDSAVNTIKTKFKSFTDKFKKPKDTEKDVKNIETEKKTIFTNDKEEKIRQLLQLCSSPYLFMTKPLQNKMNVLINSEVGKEIMNSPEKAADTIFKIQTGGLANDANSTGYTTNTINILNKNSKNTEIDFINYKIDTLTDLTKEVIYKVTDKDKDVNKNLTNDATQLGYESASLGNIKLDQNNNKSALVTTALNSLKLGTTTLDENGRVMTTSKIVDKARHSDAIKLAVVNGVGGYGNSSKYEKTVKTGKGNAKMGMKSNNIDDDTHIYQRDYSNYSFNTKTDNEKQTLGDSGCGPAAAAVVKKLYTNLNYKTQKPKNKKYGTSNEEIENNEEIVVCPEHKEIFDACKAAGFSDAAACAVLGNVYVLTGGTSDALDYWSKHYDSTSGGIARWSPWSKHVKWAKKNGYNDPWTWEANLAHLIDSVANEGNWTTSELNEFLNSADPSSASLSFSEAFNVTDRLVKTNKFGTAFNSNRFGMTNAAQRAANFAMGFHNIFVGSYDNYGYAESQHGLYTLTGFVDLITDNAVDGSALDDYIYNKNIWDEVGQGKGRKTKFGKGVDNDGFLGFGNTHFIPTKEEDTRKKYKYNNYKPIPEQNTENNSASNTSINSISNNITSASSNTGGSNSNNNGNSSGGSNQSVSSNNSSSTSSNNSVYNKVNEINRQINKDEEDNSPLFSKYNIKNRIDSNILNKMTITDINKNGNKRSTTNIYTEDNKTTLLTEGKTSIVICNNFAEKSKTDLSDLVSNFKHLNSTQENALQVLKAISDLIKNDETVIEDFNLSLDNFGLDFILKGF